MAHSVDNEVYSWAVRYDDGTRLDEMDECMEHEAARVEPGSYHVWACVDKPRVVELQLVGAGITVDCADPDREPVFFRRRVVPDVMNSGEVDASRGSTWVGYRVGDQEFLAEVLDQDGQLRLGVAR